MDETLILVKERSEELLSKLGVQGNIEVDKGEEEGSVLVKVEAEEAGALIGRHGEGIAAFQLILNQIVNQGKSEWIRIVVNCGDYRERREESLRNLASNVAEKAKETGEPQSIYNLSPDERRIIHMYLAEDASVSTHSEGENRDRHIVVTPK